MTSERKDYSNDTNSFENKTFHDFGVIPERRSRRSSLSANPLMNKIRPLIYGAKNDDRPDCYNRVRYIRDSLKIFGDLWKTDKDFLNKSIDNDVSKLFKEFRSSEVARSYRSPYGTNGIPSILNQTIDDLIQIHDLIDSKRKDLLEQFKKLIEQARDKQSTIRQTMTELRDNYEKTQKKLETADGNLKKFQTRSDRLTLPNFDERSRELEDIRAECEQARTLARDYFATETYKIAIEEHSITKNIFNQYLLEQNHFYNDVSKYLSKKLPEIEHRLEEDDLTPIFRCDLSKHCSKRNDSSIAYPIDICIHLLQNSLREEGLFRIAPSQVKQKKLVAELDLQSIDKTSNLFELGYDSHVAATVLKQYLRELPDCLLTSALLPQWNDIYQISNEQGRVQRIGQLINQLPKINYDNLCYLVGFLSRVAEHSSENKMTPSNLGICVGCSILYPKDQSSNSPVSSSYAIGSTILELMIIHYKQLFNQQETNSSKSYKNQPDLIPTEYYSKSRNNSNENLLEPQNVPSYIQPSPGTRRKHKAPPPPPSTLSQQTGNELISNQQTTIEQNSNEQISSNQTNTVTSSSFSASDKVHRRTPSGTQIDRPSAPPPLPPAVVVVPSPPVQQRQTVSMPISNSYQQDISPTNEEKLSRFETSNEPSVNQISTNDGVNVGKLISELNNRMAAAKLTNTQTNNIRASFLRNNTFNSPGENTDF